MYRDAILKQLKENLLLEQSFGVKWLLSSKAKMLEKLKNRFANCQSCELGKSRIKFVFGDGNPEAEIMFIGEAPGYEEDRAGKPFVGKAGILLDSLIKEILGLERSQVYISNIVKCHPMKDPTNPNLRGNDRAPNKSEIEKCLPILQQQIKIIMPKVIVTLGNTAAEALLNLGIGITRIHGRIYDYQGINLLPTYHPAAVLRTPSLRDAIERDFRKIKQLL